ncbi:MAG: helix-turn-helix transcriptional regulator [Planctomycetota bacterium]
MPLPVRRPVEVKMPAWGVVIAESLHAPAFHMADRAEPFHKIVFVRAGAITVRRSGPTARDSAPTSNPALPAGAMMALPRGLRHRFEDLAPATLFILCIDAAWIAADAGRAEAWQALVARADPVLRPDAHLVHGCEQIFRRLLAEQVRAGFGCGLAMRADAERLLVDLARLPSATAAPDDTNRSAGSAAEARVAAVAARLAETFFEPWTLDEAAEAAGLSRRRFTQLFAAQQGGRTFLEVLTDLRLSHAAELLARPEHSIAGAAFSAGFGDLSHFYRVFRHRFGQAPGQWRERNPT